MATRMPRDSQYTFRMPADLRTALDQLAEVEGRSLADYIVRALAAHVDAIRPAKRKGGRRG